MAWFSPVALLLLSVFGFTLSGCEDRQQVKISPENLNNQDLYQQLINQHPELAESISNTQDGLLIEGEASAVANLVSTAQKLDEPPSRYQLIISRKHPNTLSSNNKQLSILIQKGHSISLSRQMLSDIPWQGYQSFNDHDLLTVTLDQDLILSISISDSQNRQHRAFNTQVKIQPDTWLLLYGAQGKEGVKRMATHNEQLWVKLSSSSVSRNEH